MSANITHPDVLGRLAAARPLRELARYLGKTGAATASGLWGSSLAAVTAAIEAELHRPILVVCGHIDEADDLADDLELFHGRRPEVVPALELGGSLGRISEELVASRLQMMTRLAASAREKSTGTPQLLVAPIHALMQSVPSPQQLTELTLTLKIGQELEPEKLIVGLSEHGYNRLDGVEVPGDFAVRGGIVDIYLPGEFKESGEQVGLSVRIDFFGDQIESIKRFDLDTLGSGTPIPSVQALDLKGQLPDTSLSTHLFSYIHPDTIIAYSMNGDKLPLHHGFPLRAIVPGWYGMDAVKWLHRVELAESEEQSHAYVRRVSSFFGVREAEPITAMQVKSVFTRPQDGAILTKRRFIVRGMAWAGENRVEKVEVSVDGASTWQTAKLEEVPVEYSWLPWSFDWKVPNAGEYTLSVRAKDDKGREQPRQRATERSDSYEWNDWQTVKVTAV